MNEFCEKPAPMKEIMEKLLSRLGIENGILQGRAFVIWDEVVGEINAKKTKPIRVEGGKLFIRTTDSVWRQELFFQKSEIIKRLNNRLMKDVIKDIIFL